MLSVMVDGKVLDFKYKQLSKGHYAFYIGDILIGQTFKVAKAWTAVIDYRPAITVGAVHGFKTRNNTSQYMLKCCGF